MLTISYLNILLLYWNIKNSCPKVVKNHASCVRHCTICSLTFRRVNEYERHLIGKRHLEQLKYTSTPESIFQQYQQDSLKWSENSTIEDIKSVWRDEELSTIGLRYRSTCLHPSSVVKEMQSYTRARIWRYLYDFFGHNSHEIATIIAAVDEEENGHLRIKELFESFESYKILGDIK